MADLETWDRATLVKLAADALAKLEALQAEQDRLQEDLAEARQDRRMVLTRWHEAMHMNADLLAKLARLEGTR